jgi:hypothetical protein
MPARRTAMVALESSAELSGDSTRQGQAQRTMPAIPRTGHRDRHLHFKTGAAFVYSFFPWHAGSAQMVDFLWDVRQERTDARAMLESTTGEDQFRGNTIWLPSLDTFRTFAAQLAL